MPRRRVAEGRDMRGRVLTVVVDNGAGDDSRSRAHIAMARARRRRGATPLEEPVKGTGADRCGRRSRSRRQVRRTIAVVGGRLGATGKTARYSGNTTA